MSGPDWLRLIVLSVLWGGSFFFCRCQRAPVLPPLTIVLARVGLAALVLAGVLPLIRVPWPKGWRVWAALAVMGFFNNVAPFTLFVVAQGQISSGLAPSILNATTPLWGVVVAHLATRDERLSWPKAPGVLAGFAGVAVMMGGAWGSGRTALAQAASSRALR
ncbi:DMT family transporter [Novosphingobium sp. MW5]|nr:DMT family transporter [Novosphingobium sp. MW5]